MKYMMRIMMTFKADNDMEAIEYARKLTEANVENKCAVELVMVPEEEKGTEEQSFQELLDNLNSSDMTKN